MDGMFVTEAARGRGIGTRLLTAIKQEAKARGLRQVRLDVIDTTPTPAPAPFARARGLLRARCTGSARCGMSLDSGMPNDERLPARPA